MRKRILFEHDSVTKLEIDKPMIINKTAISLLILIILGFSGLYAKDQKHFEPLVPYKTDEPPVIDGKLDDPVWIKAPHESGFITYTPDYGKPMADDTIVYYAYDQENLYFAFRCFDSEPDKIKASVSARDKISPDDWICINLDTFNDHQSLYAIYVNPFGVQMDSRFEGGDEDFTVDIIWYSAGLIDEQGYSIEVRIPFKSLRLSHTKPVVMGVIFERMISRRTQAGTYPEFDPAVGPNFLTQTRPLIFKDIKHYTLFEVLPAVTYSQTSEAEAGKLTSNGGEGDLSLTAKYGITSRLIFDGTYNPDFSQVEADAGQVDFNLRYALFYPEKRPFFLEGLEKFNFGGSHSGDPLGEVVHTRTIVNPILGFKLNGKIGSKDTIASIYALDDLSEEAADERAHFGIFRYKRSLAEDGFIGGFYTGRERESGFNRVAGTDGQFRINPSSIFGFYTFFSQTKPDREQPRKDGHALSLHYYSSTRNWIVMAGLQDISKDFQTETGYLTRNGITWFRSGIVRMFYPKSKFLLRIDPLVHFFLTRDRFSHLYESYSSFDIRFLFSRSSYITIGGRYATEIYLGEKFDTSRFRLNASSNITKSFTLSAFYYYQSKIRYLSEPYQGQGNDAALSMEFLPSANLHLELSVLYSDFFRQPDMKKEYDYMIIRSKNTYQVNKYLFFRGIVEYNSFYKTILTDFLASFTYIPGTVIHIGYGSFYEKLEWRDGLERPSDNFMETRRGFFFKASYLWRL
jgi:hypothetical protein